MKIQTFLYFIVGVLLIVVVGGFALLEPKVTDSTQQSEDQKGEAMQSGKTYAKQPDMIIDENKSYSALLKTDLGDITISLHADKTPVTVNNFVFLSREGFYDGTIFHRVMKNFMIQGGDPLGNGTGGPGYAFDDEEFFGDYDRGIVAMANSGPDTNGSQFFIMHQDYELSPDYVIFGEVTQGMDVVDAIAESEVEESSSGEFSKPVDPVTVDNVEIIES